MVAQSAAGGLDIAAVAHRFVEPLVFHLRDIDRRVPGASAVEVPIVPDNSFGRVCIWYWKIERLSA
jgi:hypothetical protein